MVDAARRPCSPADGDAAVNRVGVSVGQRQRLAAALEAVHVRLARGLQAAENLACSRPLLLQFYGTLGLTNSVMAHWDDQTELWHMGLSNSVMAHWDHHTGLWHTGIIKRGAHVVTVESRDVEPGYVKASCRWRAGSRWPYLEQAAGAMRIAAYSYAGQMTFTIMQCGTKSSSETNGWSET